MSEQQAEYLGKAVEENTYQIRDEAPHDHYTQMPNIVDDANLTPHAYRLYGHLRRVAGESGRCWQSTKTLAKACNMSVGKVSEAKKELENTIPPLIRVTEKVGENGIYHEITITDIWALNHDFFANKGVHIVNNWGGRSQYEHPRSQCERKNNPIKNNPIGADAPKPSMPIEWQIVGNEKQIVKPDEEQARRADFANLLAMGMMNADTARAIALAFQEARGITLPTGKVKGQRKAVKEMIEMGVKPEHVRTATKQLMERGMTITDLFSIVKTAIDLANSQKPQERSRTIPTLERDL